MGQHRQDETPTVASIIGTGFAALVSALVSYSLAWTATDNPGLIGSVLGTVLTVLLTVQAVDRGMRRSERLEYLEGGLERQAQRAETPVESDEDRAGYMFAGVSVDQWRERWKHASGAETQVIHNPDGTGGWVAPQDRLYGRARWLDAPTEVIRHG